MYGKNNPGRHYCRDWCCFMDIYIFSGGFCAFLGKTAIGAFGGVWCTERDLWVRKKACNPWDYRLLWSWQCDSNTRPADYESAALPTELCQRNFSWFFKGFWLLGAVIFFEPGSWFALSTPQVIYHGNVHMSRSFVVRIILLILAYVWVVSMLPAPSD